MANKNRNVVISPRNESKQDFQRPVMSEPPKKKLSDLSDFTYDTRFTYNFCSCCEDCKLCCCGTFCLPCLICSLYMDAKEGCCAGCWQCFTTILPFFNICCSDISTLRSKIRGTYKLHGSLLEDNLYSTLCPCCATIQMKLELRAQGVID